MPEPGALDSQKRSVGAYLREVRESQGLSVEEAARVTRIGKNYLLALEGDLFEKLPNPAYIKGFLRVYAGYLGLSGDEIIAMYDRVPAPPLQFSSDTGMSEPPRGGDARSTGPARWLVPSILLIAVITAAYIVRGKDEKMQLSPAPVKQAPVAAIPAPALTSRSTALKPEVAGASVAPPPKKEIIPSGGEQTSGIILKLKVNQDCWLNITIDSTVSQQYDLKAGDLIEWKGEKVFVLDLGNAGGIEAEFNGRPLKPFGEPGKAAHVVLKVDGA